MTSQGKVYKVQRVISSMMTPLNYPSVEKIIELNVLALTFIKVKKADQPRVLSRGKILRVLDACRKQPGDVFDKAASLLSGLVRAHGFASGNRRTAFLAAKHFLRQNKARMMVEGASSPARTMLGIREGFYSHNEIRRWLRNGTIRPFHR